MSSTGDLYDLRATSERRWLGACLAFHYLLASVPALAIHEAGHTIVHLLAGDTVYAFHVTPFAGQVLALYPAPTPTLDALENLGGIMATQIVLYSLAGLGVLVRRRIPFFLDTLYLVVLVVLAIDALYLLGSGPFHFGDVYNATKGLGWSSWAFVIPGLIFTYANYRLIRNRMRQWARRQFGDSVSRSGGMVFRWSLATLLPTIFIYWAFVSPMESPW